MSGTENTAFESPQSPEGRVTLSRSQTLYQDGLACARTGRYEDAIRLMREAVRLDSQMIEAYMDLGLVFHTLGRYPEAVQSFEKAVGIEPGNPSVYNNLGKAFIALNKLEEAEKCFNRACALEPNHVKALYNKACLHMHRDEYAEAEVLYRKALEIDESFYLAHQDLATLLKLQGKVDEAIAHYQSAVRLEPEAPGCAISYHGLGVLASQHGDLTEAVHYYQEALRLNPDFTTAYYNLGGAFVMQGQHKSASICYEKTMQLDPDMLEVLTAYADVMRLMGRYELAIHYYQKSLDKGQIDASTYSSMGLCFAQIGQYERSEKCLDKAKMLDPELTTAYYNMGLLLEKQHRWDEARQQYNAVIDILKHTSVRSRMRLGILDILDGDLKQGWPQFERRLADKIFYPMKLSQPMWDGKTSLKGKTILVVGETYMGDTLQCLRYLPKLKRKGAWVVLACPEDWHGLLENSPGVDAVVPLKAERLDGGYDTMIYSLSLPAVFKTDIDSIPAVGKPFKPEATLKRGWKKRLSKHKNLKVGLLVDFAAAPPAFNKAFQTVFKTDHPLPVNFFDIRPNLPPAHPELRVGETGIEPLGIEIHDMTNWLAALSMMDVIIATDGIGVHLAAMLGKPVWVMLNYEHHWRWMLDRSDSPWYPTVKLFRQQDSSEWLPLWQAVYHELQAEAK